MEGLRIEPLREDDWPAVAAIYREGIESRLATFETEVPEWSAWDERPPAGAPARCARRRRGRRLGRADARLAPGRLRGRRRPERLRRRRRARPRRRARAARRARRERPRRRALDAPGGRLPGERARASRCIARSASATSASASESAGSTASGATSSCSSCGCDRRSEVRASGSSTSPSRRSCCSVLAWPIRRRGCGRPPTCSGGGARRGALTRSTSSSGSTTTGRLRASC